MGTINGLNGAAIRASLATALNEHVMALSGVAVNDMMPTETKVARRLDSLNKAVAVITEAESAFRAWAEQERAGATVALNKRPIGSAAEESRRVAEELRLSRMIQTAVASGTPQTAAKEFAAQASQAYLDATGEEGYREARLLAQAAITLNGPSVATDVLNAAERQLETPEQRAARATLAQLDVEDLATQRDLTAQAAAVLAAAAKAAESVGDSRAATEYTARAAKASMTSKMLAFKVAQETEQAYTQPAGALTDRPTGEPVRMTDGMVDRLTHNMNTGAVA